MGDDLGGLRAALRRQLAAAAIADWEGFAHEAATVRGHLAVLDGRYPPASVLEVAHLQLRLDALIARQVRERAPGLLAASAASAYRRLGGR